MRHFGNRTIKVRKADLISKIKANKELHIKAYQEAVIAYKEEALRQLAELTERANNGDLNITLKLIAPIDNADDYDKVVEMFEWEVDDIVELEQNEFNQYVQDETDFAIQAKASNSFYLSNSR